MSRGAFITVEGSDGAGKTTQLNFIETLIRGQGIEVVRTREPGGTALGEKLRTLLLDSVDLPISDKTELLMVFAARQQHLDELIRPALEAGKWVLSDRFTDATYAYQGAGRGLAATDIARLEHWVQGKFKPDLTLVLDVDVQLGIARSVDRGEKPDRFEREAMRFKQAVRLNYLQRAEQDPKRMRVIDSSGNIDAIQQRIADELEQFFALVHNQ